MTTQTSVPVAQVFVGGGNMGGDQDAYGSPIVSGSYYVESGGVCVSGRFTEHSKARQWIADHGYADPENVDQDEPEWTEHTFRCHSCARLCRISKDALDEAVAGFKSEGSDYALSNAVASFEVCLACEFGFVLSGEVVSERLALTGRGPGSLDSIEVETGPGCAAPTHIAYGAVDGLTVRVPHFDRWLIKTHPAMAAALLAAYTADVRAGKVIR